MTKSFTKLSFLRPSIIAVTAITAATLLFQSCKKEDNPTINSSILSVVNTSPTLGTFNFYLDQAKMNSAALPFGGSIGYTQIKSGDYMAKLTTESNTTSLLTKKISLENNKFYSLFIVDKAEALDYLLITDDIKQPSGEKASIRFINLSPNAPALSLKVKDGDALITDKAYKAVSDFIEVDAKVYKFVIVDKATGTTITKNLEDLDVKKGKIYTIIARGLLNNTDTQQPFGGQFITNQ